MSHLQHQLRMGWRWFNYGLFLNQERHDNHELNGSVEDFLTWDFDGMRNQLQVGPAYRTLLLGAARSPACFHSHANFDTTCIWDGCDENSVTGIILLGLVLIDRPRLLVVIICLAVLDGGKLVIPWNVPTGFLKWFLESGKPDIDVQRIPLALPHRPKVLLLLWKGGHSCYLTGFVKTLHLATSIFQ